MSGRRSKKDPPFVEIAVQAVVVVVFSSAAWEDPKTAAVKRSNRDRDTMAGLRARLSELECSIKGRAALRWRAGSGVSPGLASLSRFVE